MENKEFSILEIIIMTTLSVLLFPVGLIGTGWYIWSKCNKQDRIEPIHELEQITHRMFRILIIISTIISLYILFKIFDSSLLFSNRDMFNLVDNVVLLLVCIIYIFGFIIFFRSYGKRTGIINEYNETRKNAFNTPAPRKFPEENSRALIVWGTAMLIIAVLALFSTMQPDQYLGESFGAGIIFYILGPTGLILLIKGLKKSKH